ncbi:FRG domain-containing protein [Mesorhizobium sp. M6A.T.Ce.TU.016.01.1.1]|uniref:FRG domain-containing protein n=1 Tax=Mesorhizobium sp. M6A.T.Ce.TU.016.01.1.1 TaxID=2496783 RepID=UPI00163B6D19|nr:FRG domain-containing protein [Mesorhizobium sp. M6A.T.Ce.TU.016.01.1.1]
MTEETPGPSLRSNYFEQLPAWPNFDFLNNDIDGRVPVCRIEDWQSFERLIEAEHEQIGGGDRIYRGQRRYDWQIAATLTREFDGGAIPPEMSRRLLNRFQLAMRGRGTDMNGNDDNEIWAFGQHFGLATPLLDWTESPFVALFFAFAQEDDPAEKPNDSRAVFSLNRGLVEELLPELFFEPALGENARLVNQAGLFTVTPSGDDNLVSAIIDAVVETGAVDPDNPKEIARYIYKVHIPNQGRVACLSMLRRMNIHHANLFPDPTGASQYSNDWLQREVAERKRAEAARKAVESRAVPPPPDHGPPTAVSGEPHSIEELLNQLIVPEDSLTAATTSEWAGKIASTYQEHASLDWPIHISTRKEINIRIRRLLNALGFPSDRRDDAMRAIVAFYADEYIRTHGLSDVLKGDSGNDD